MGILLTEENYNDYEILFEESSSGKWGEPKIKKCFLKGEFSRCGVVNKNKRIYPREIFELAIKENLDKIKNRQMLGEVNHPQTPIVDPLKASHVITKLELLENGIIYGEAEIFDTPSGLIIQELIKRNIKIGISSRGYGQTVVNRQGLHEVSKGFKLFTFDIVSDSSSFEAYPNAIFENNNYLIKQKTIKDVLIESFKK